MDFSICAHKVGFRKFSHILVNTHITIEAEKLTSLNQVLLMPLDFSDFNEVVTNRYKFMLH